MNRLVQMVPAYHREDAIGQHIRTIDAFFRSTGWETHIVALDVDPDLVDQVTPWDPSLAHIWKGAVWVLHYALPSVLTTFFRQAPGCRVLIYHNITPPEYFLPWAPELASLALAGRREVAELHSVVDWAFADSEYNAFELRSMGYERVSVLPILVEWDRYPSPSPWARASYLDPFYDYWIFVGRVVPNKRIEDLIRLLFWYRKFYNTAVRLLIVGKTNNTPQYVRWLYTLRDALHLTGQDVAFLGVIPYEDLAACYAGARVFITLSDHEGFCLPVLEAMHYGTPVVAYAAGALPETVGEGGVLVRTRDPFVLAELMHILMQLPKEHPSLRAAQSTQLARFDGKPYLIRLREQLEVLR